MVDLTKIPKEKWDEANRRGIILRPLAELGSCPRDKAIEAANQLGISPRMRK